jgi:membrane-bound lytic murein transglycosylase B
VGSHRPNTAGSQASGRHRSIDARAPKVSPGRHAAAPPSLLRDTVESNRGAKHYLTSRNRPTGRWMVSAVGVSLAAAPWAILSFAPAGHSAPVETAQTQSSSTQAPLEYAPLVDVPFSSATMPTEAFPSTGAANRQASGAEASPPPEWLIDSQLREPASTVGTSALVSASLLNSLTATGIPRRALAAYISAADEQDKESPSCKLSWEVLAGIGYIESDHARSGGSALSSWSGIASPPIYGPLLDGSNGYPAIKDTDSGVLDGNSTYDRAVGPMQFLPSTWREYEESDSGTPNPQNIDDAALAAGRYLCATGASLATPDGLIAAVYGYNHSFEYVQAVLSVALRYASGNLPGGASALVELPTLAAEVADLPSNSSSPEPEVSPSPMPSPTPPVDDASSPTETPTSSSSASGAGAQPTSRYLLIPLMPLPETSSPAAPASAPASSAVSSPTSPQGSGPVSSQSQNPITSPVSSPVSSPSTSPSPDQSPIGSVVTSPAPVGSVVATSSTPIASAVESP